MKPIYCLIVSLCWITLARAQDNPQTEVEILFEEAVDHFEKENYQAAAEGFQQFLTKHTDSQLLVRAHYNLALSHYMKKDYATAKKVFLEILNRPYNERDENNLMEPYALYKHHTCRHLAEIALNEKDYKAAEKYIHAFDKKYPYQHFCGNEWSAYDMFKAVMKAKVFEGKGETRKAMEELLPHIFYNGLASNDEVLDELSSILDSHFTAVERKQAFGNAFQSLEVKERKNERSATIQLFGVTIAVEDYYFDGGSNREQSATEYYRQVLQEHTLFKKYL